MGRAPCCDKTKVKRGPWSPEEDNTLKSFLHKHGTAGNWIALPQKAGLKRCGKSCRLRWLNYLRPDIKHGGFTDEEDQIILTLYSNIGSRWSVIASHLPGRTDNDVKNYWNTKLKKKLCLAAAAAAATNCPNNNSNVFTHSINPINFDPINYYGINSNSVQELVTSQFPMSNLMEVQENCYNNANIIASSYNNQEIQFGYESNFGSSWFSNGGNGEENFCTDMSTTSTGILSSSSSSNSSSPLCFDHVMNCYNGFDFHLEKFAGTNLIPNNFNDHPFKGFDC